MKVYLSGNHTAPYGNFPYEKGEEFENALKEEWNIIVGFHFNCIDGAEVLIKSESIINWTLQEVLDKMRVVVAAASKKCDWNIWTVYI